MKKPFKVIRSNTIRFYIVSRTIDLFTTDGASGMGMNVRTLLMLLAVFLMELPISTTWAQSPLIEGAKKEGELNWYTSMSAVDHTKYLELFNKNTRSSK
jgi:hypothetical protein